MLPGGHVLNWELATVKIMFLLLIVAMRYEGYSSNLLPLIFQVMNLGNNFFPKDSNRCKVISPFIHLQPGFICSPRFILPLGGW